MRWEIRDKQATLRTLFPYGTITAAANTLSYRANTALAGLTAKHKNAFSIVSPLILDSSVFTMSEDAYSKSLRRVSKWGMTARGEW